MSQLPRLFCLCFLLSVSLASLCHAQGLPQVENLRARLFAPAQALPAVPGLDDAAAPCWMARYRLAGKQLEIAVYLSRSTPPTGFGPSPVKLPGLGQAAPGASLGYRVLGAKPAWLLSRPGKAWVLFVFPDEPIDVAGFIQDFSECLGFFERRLGSASLPELFPSLVGTIQGVR